MRAPFLTALPPRRKKLLAWLAGLLLFYTLAGFLILPPIVRAIAVKRISKALDRSVTIQKLRLNPFTLSATIRGLLIKDKDGEPFISWDEVHVNFQLVSFLSRPWVFKEISISQPYLRVQINKDYTLNFSDLVDKFSRTATPQAKDTRPLALRVDLLRIAGAKASFADLTPSPARRRRLPISRRANLSGAGSARSK